MLNIQEIKQDLKQSMLSKNSVKTEVLRGLISAARYKMVEIGKKEDEITNEDLIKVIEKQAKQRKDSIEAFKNGNREDLAKKEQDELEIIAAYLPTKMSPNETRAIILKTISELNIASKAQMGQLMGFINKNYSGKMDMSLVSKIASESLK